MITLYKKLFLIKLCFFILLATSCVNVSPPPPNDLASFPRIRAQHIVFIGFDGWGGKYVNNADMPTVKRMMKQSASSLYQYSVMPSNSMENWTALFTSMPLGEDNPGSFPSIFSIVNEKYKTGSAFFYEWDWLDVITSDEITEKHKILSDMDSAKMISAYIIEKKPVFTAIVFNEPDSVGHNKGWGSALYLTKLSELDSFITIIEQAVKDAGIYNDTVFVLSSDHGGALFGHGVNLPSNRRIPLVVYGNIIKEDYVIPAKKSIYDIAPTMAVILDLEIPDEWVGQPILGVFK